MRLSFAVSAAAALVLAGCADFGPVPATDADVAALRSANSAMPENTGVITANGWYEEEEIYYILGGVENVAERGRNQLYLIGGDRAFQGNVALHIPGEPGYSPHWNVNEVHTAPGVTVQDIIDAGLASAHFFEGEPVLFDDAEDVLEAEALGLVTLVQPGVVVLCPVISEEGAEAPGNTELPSDVFPNDFILNEGF